MMMYQFMFMIVAVSAAAVKEEGYPLSKLLDKVLNIGEMVSSLMVNGYKTKPTYMGCYIDESDRMLETPFILNNIMSHELCISYCSKLRRKYAGLQNSNECFCGNVADTVKYPRKPESECNKPCKGNAKQMCGAALRNSLYLL